jgi:hypothetical protein
LAFHWPELLLDLIIGTASQAANASENIVVGNVNGQLLRCDPLRAITAIC